MTEQTSPRTVVDRLISGVTGQRWDELPDLYDEYAIVEHPFADPPTRLEGREQIRQHFAAGSNLPLRMRARNVVLYETTDPEVVIAEFDYDGEVTTNGHTFTAANILVVRVRDGRIVASRDFHNHPALAAALGRPA
jgi:ketosteroid isomerase-like protein